MTRSLDSSSPERLVSIVIPIYNEEAVLPIMRKRLDVVISSLDLRCEVVMVDDGSTDRSKELIRAFTKEDDRYRAVILSRNYGHQVALTAGLDHANGDAVVVLDADLQDPPELIAAMIDRWRSGYDVVYGQRTSRLGESFAKRLTARYFYRIMQKLAGITIPENVGDFRLMDAAVVGALRRMPEHFRYVRGLVAWAGYRQTALPFERQSRAAGTTKYSWKKMTLFALDAIFAFSVVPLRFAIGLGLLVTIVAAVEVIRTLYLRFIAGTVIPGFSALFVAVLLLGGFNLVFLGILGEYVGRIYVEAKNRPLYFVQELISRRETEDNTCSV